jgi:hypothetical protein
VPKPPPLIQCFRSQRYTICVHTANVRSKLLQITFSRKDGSIFVGFPYYEHSVGLVSAATLAPGSDVLDLEPGGKITSHLVKYSHHPEGRAHFSQDGKVFTRVRKQSVPLDEVAGHLFTLQVQGLHGFDVLEEARWDEPPNERRTTLTFDLGIEAPEAVKIVARLYTGEALHNAISRSAGPTSSNTVGPITVTQDPTGVERPAFLASAPSGRPGDHRILVLIAEVIPSMTADEDTTLTFIGAFDPQATALDPMQSTSVLALVYPASTVDELLPRIGTIDLVPGEPSQ